MEEKALSSLLAWFRNSSLAEPILTHFPLFKMRPQARKGHARISVAGQEQSGGSNTQTRLSLCPSPPSSFPVGLLTAEHFAEHRILHMLLF